MELKQTIVKVAILAVVIAAMYMVSVSYVEHDPDELDFDNMYINVENGAEIVSKDIDYNCVISIDGEYYELDETPATIKGRGNSTWNEPKKPYSIKFDTKVGLYGLEASKKWVLLANYKDKSFARNALAFKVADALGCEFTPDCKFVNLYLNGVYAGVYQISEKIEVAKGRVDIDDSTKKEDFGFLVELDSHAADDGVKDVDYFEMGGKLYTIKDPSCNAEQAAHVKSVMQTAWDAIRSGSWSELEKYVDADTFARTYVVQELFSNADVDFSSFYLYRDAGDRLCSGPVWDFDLSAGNHDTFDRILTDRLFVAENSAWYSELLKYPEFVDKVTDIIRDNYDRIKSAIAQERYYIFYLHMGEFEKDQAKWRSINKNVYSTPFQYMVLTQWIYHLDYTTDWLYDKLDYMNKYYVKGKR